MRLAEAKVFENLFGRLINFKTLLIILLFTTSIGWFADGLEELIKLIVRTNFSNSVSKIVYPTVLITTGLITLLSLFYLAKKEISKFKFSLDVVDSPPEKTKNLVLFLSTMGRDNIELAKNFISLNDFRTAGKPISWEMPLIAINYHLPVLKNILVITSKESSPVFEDFKKIAHNMFGNEINIEKYEKVIDFEDIKEVYKVLRESFDYLIKSGKAKKDKDIIIDVTGGKKIPSIAGAIFTVDKENKKFQYVSTTTKEVKGFDVLIIPE
ncbi:hypothetical protein [Persephonella sp.]